MTDVLKDRGLNDKSAKLAFYMRPKDGAVIGWKLAMGVAR